MPTKDVLELACQLIAKPSVTPLDEGCQDVLAARLSALGFRLEQLDRQGVRNMWAIRGESGPHLMFAGHTDVVPTGPVEQWQTAPFTPTVKDEVLCGRGAADMKSSLAAMVVATERALTKDPEIAGTLSFLITSDEEGDAVHGTRYAIEVLNGRGIKPDYCIVGEPSSSQQVGDVIRCGRRGSLNGKLLILGQQGHVAYPHEAVNPIHQAMAALDELAKKSWDNGNQYYPPTSLQISNIHAGTGASNVVPGTLEVQFNLRFNTEQTDTGLRAAVTEIAERHDLDFELSWQLSGEPFLTETGILTDAVVAAIQAEQGFKPELSTSGGTSDGRFISPWQIPNSSQVEVVELGPTNATIHKIDECIALHELAPLTKIYQRIIQNLLSR